MEDPSLANLSLLLSSFYDVDIPDADEPTDQEPINSPHFDASAHVRETLQERGLSSLIDYSHELARDTRELDTNMQNLVYENYNKFISATDTVRQMKDSVAEMETEISELSTGIEKVTARYESVSAKFRPNREAVAKLVGVKGLLTKLEFLFDLPQRLRRSIELGAFAQAVRYYSMSIPVLRRYSDVSSFSSIADEAEEIKKSLIEKLKQQVGKQNASPSVIVESLQLLVQLGEPVDDLITSFVEFHDARLRACLQPANIASLVDPAASLPDLASAFSNVFVGRFNQALADFNEVFSTDHSGKTASDAAAPPTDLQSTVRRFAKEQYAAYLDQLKTAMLSQCRAIYRNSSAGSDALNQLHPALQLILSDARVLHQKLPEARLRDRAAEAVEHIVRHSMQHLFDGLREDLADIINHALAEVHLYHSSDRPTVGPAFLHLVAVGCSADAASLLSRRLDQSKFILDAGGRIMPELQDAFVALLRGCTFQTLRWFSAQLRRAGLQYGAALNTVAVAYPGVKAQTSAVEVLSPDLAAAEGTLSDGAGQEGGGGADGSGVELTPAEVKLAHVCGNVIPSTALLVLGYAAKHFSEHGIPATVTCLLTVIPQADSDEPDNLGTMMALPVVIRDMNDTSAILLQQYVRAVSLSLCALLRRSMQAADFFATRVPREPRMVLSLITAELLKVDSDSRDALKAGPRPSRKSRRPTAAGGGGGGAGGSSGSVTGSTSGMGGRRFSSRRSDFMADAMQADIHRMLDTSHSNLDALHYDTSSILAHALAGLQRTWIQLLRRSRFSTQGFQQVQVDCAAVTEVAGALVQGEGDMAVLESRFAELLRQARERAVEPTALGDSIVTSLVESKVNGWLSA